MNYALKFLIGLTVLATLSAATQEQNKPFNFVADYIEGSPKSHFASDGVLNVIFPADKFGPQESGYNFSARINPSIEKTISYEVKVPKNFSFMSCLLYTSPSPRD